MELGYDLHGVRHARSIEAVANTRSLNRYIPKRSVVTSPATSRPDAIFEIGTEFALSQDQIAEFTTAFRNAVLPPDSQLQTQPPAPQAAVLPGQVLIVGVWLNDDGSDGDRLGILLESGFLPPVGSPGDTNLGLFLSADMIQFQASYNWPQSKPDDGDTHFSDNIATTLSPAGVRTIVDGTYDARGGLPLSNSPHLLTKAWR